MSEARAPGDPPPIAAPPPATAGEALRAARERQAMPLEILAASIKVSQRKLELLESDRYDELPGSAFIRALALSVCRALKLDPEPVLARLPRPDAHDLDSVSMGLNAPFKDRNGRTAGREWHGLVNMQTVAAVLLVGGAAAVYWAPTGWWPRWGSDGATRVVGSAPGSITTSAPQAPAAVSSALPADAAASAAVPGPAASSIVDTVFSSPAAPADGPAAGGMLILRAAAESWVEVRDGAGRILLSRSLAPGEAAGLDGSLPLRLVVGNAEATQVTFRGQPVMLAATRDNVARLELK